MSEAEIYERVREILEENLGIEPDKVTPEAEFRSNLGLDSLDIVDLVFFLQQGFGVSGRLDDYRDIHTVALLVEYIARTGTE